MTSRKERAFKQQIFLLSMDPITKEYERIFKVVGTTGNIYTVEINGNPKCSCPDCCLNGNICKHIYFILLRVMKMNENVKSTYNMEQLTNMFNNIPKFITDNVIYNEKAKVEFEKIINSNTIHTKQVEQKLDDVCPICLENIDDNKDTDFCKYGCGKSVHKFCFDIWRSNHDNALRCLFCRHEWYSINNADDDDDDAIFSVSNSDSSDSTDGDCSDCSDSNLNNANESDNLDSNLNNESDNLDSNANESNDLDHENASETDAHLKQYKVHDLQNICKQKGLPYYGTKRVIYNRIKQFL